MSRISEHGVGDFISSEQGIDRRTALALLASAGAALALGGTACAKRPTAPAALLNLQPGQPLALVNANVVDVDAGALIAGWVVLIKNGKIAGLFEPEHEALQGALRLDCQGGYLIPGLINTHSHVNMPGLQTIGMGDLGLMQRQIKKNYQDALCWGVTTLRDMTSVPKMMRRDRRDIADGKLAGPRILTPISFISVPGGYPDFGGVPNAFARMFTGEPVLRGTSAAQVRGFVRQVADQGADLVKIGFDHRSFIWGRTHDLPVISDELVDAIMDEATEVNLPVAAHHLYLQGLERGLRFKVHSLEHVAMDGPLSDAQISAAVDSKLPFVPTLTIAAVYAFSKQGVADPAGPEIGQARAWRDEQLMPELPQHCLNEVAQRGLETYDFYASGAYAWPANRKVESFNPVLATQGIVEAVGNVRRLIQAGAVIGVGNDSGVPLIFPGMVHLEMRLLCVAGMTPAAALRAATLVNARICRIEDRCGTIEPGKVADLALLDGDPLADVTNVGKVRAVFQNGNLVSAADGFKTGI